MDYDFPRSCTTTWTGLAPRTKIGKGLYGPHTADMAERLGLSLQEARALPRHARGRGRGGKRLKFLRDVRHGGCTGPTASPQPLHGGLHKLKHSERRQLKTAGSVVAEKVVKLTQTPSSAANPDKFRNTNAYMDPAKFERAVGKSSVTNFKLQNDSEGFLERMCGLSLEVTDLRVEPPSRECPLYFFRCLFSLSKKIQNGHPRPGAPSS